MKKILAIFAISFSALMASSFSTAAPQFENPNNDMAYNKPDQPDSPKFRSEEDRNEKRRMREERGVKRLKQHKWQMGYVMPQHYRGNSYKIEYKDYNLSKPARNQQWYKVNNDLILIDSESNNIVKIQSL